MEEHQNKNESNASAPQTENSSGNNDSVYAYLDRNDFTSEKYKIEIRGLPKFYGFGVSIMRYYFCLVPMLALACCQQLCVIVFFQELKTLISDTLKLNCTKVKPPRRGSYWAYACFRSEEDRSKAIEILNGYQWKKSTLKAMVGFELIFQHARY